MGNVVEIDTLEDLARLIGFGIGHMDLKTVNQNLEMFSMTLQELKRKESLVVANPQIFDHTWASSHLAFELAVNTMIIGGLESRRDELLYLENT